MLLAVLSAVLSASGPAEHSPAFWWSPQAIAGLTRAEDVSRERLTEATSADLERTVGALIGKRMAEQGSPLFAGRPATAPEVHLVFLAEGLQTDAVRKHGARLPALNALLEQSVSALSMPFTLQTQPRLFEDATRVAGNEAEAYFKAHSKLFSNGVPEVVVIELRAAAAATTEEVLASHDALIGRIARAVETGTQGRYAALLTGNSGAHGVRRLAVAAPTVYLHTTPTLLTAQLICLALIVIFLSGFCCLFSLQTPKKFEENKSA
jgi:hypothetical protein